MNRAIYRFAVAGVKAVDARHSRIIELTGVGRRDEDENRDRELKLKNH